MLPLDDRVPGQVTDVCHARLATGLDYHPAHMGPKKSLVGIVWVEVGVGVTVVCAVAPCPPLNGTFDGPCAQCCENVLERLRRVIRTMSP
jgi:hypothetical protein